jgi:hypothetical protein
MAELSEDFVTQGISTLVLVLDLDALRLRMGEGGEDARMADKALESALCEEIEGYLLVSRQHEGWDATLALILALDRDHRELLERVLDRCANVASELVEDMDALTSVLTREAALAEDVEAEREDRRSQAGHVEPRAARAFLQLARTPMGPAADEPRDTLTHAYFRQLARHAEPEPARGIAPRPVAELLREVAPLGPNEETSALPSPDEERGLAPALRSLAETDPKLFRERVEELAYLANVLVAGAALEGRRFRPSEAADAVLATVGLGAELEVAATRIAANRASSRATVEELSAVLRVTGADRLFRRASATLAADSNAGPGYLRSAAELDDVLAHPGGSAQPSRGSARTSGARPKPVRPRGPSRRRS